MSHRRTPPLSCHAVTFYEVLHFMIGFGAGIVVTILWLLVSDGSDIDYGP